MIKIFIIDRFEGGYAVCEPYVETDGARGAGVPAPVNVPRRLIDADAGEGAVIVYNPESRRYAFDGAATARRAERIRRLAENLWKKK